MTRFIADAMLGRLARWLRMLGFDTLYYADIEDHAVMRIAREQDRVILTRDSDFRKKGMGPCLFIKSDHVEEQLQQVVTELRLSLPATRRCPECNGSLMLKDRRMIQSEVPEYIYHSHETFHQCSACGRIYWEGSHFSKFSLRIRELFPEEKSGL